MTRGLSKLLTATFTLILLGGVATPAVAYADSSTDTVAATTKADEQTYEISSAEIPYTSIIQNSQELKNYWFHKTADDANILEPHSLTMAQLKDNTYLSNLSAANNNDPYALQMGAAVTQIFGESMTLSKGESVGEYLFSRSTDDHFTFDEYREVLSIQMYISTWMTKYLTLAKNNQISDEAISTDYNENLRPIIVTLADHDEQLRSFDTLFGTAENFSGWKNYLIDNLLPSTITSAHLDGLTDEQLAKSSPSVSADIAKSVWDAPMTDYLTKQSDGTYQLNGLILFGVFNVISDGTTVTKPTIPVIPDPTPTPTPAKSQPVTVTYVDDQGKTLAPSKTLTGDLDATYQSDALNIAGYKLSKTPTNATGKFTSEAQTVTYVYTKQGTLQSGSAADTIDTHTLAPKGAVVYATKKVGLYKTATFSKKNLKRWYVKKSRTNRPMFVVTGYATSKNGVKRYRVKDVNHHSKTAGKTGYLTTNNAYTTPVYYAAKHKTVTVINPTGVNSYAKKTLTGKKTHYRQGQTLKVKKVVSNKLTTRFVLKNGRYITANKKLIQAGKVTMPRQIKTTHAINRYSNVSLTKQNRHLKKGTKLAVRGWAYTNTNNFSKHDTLRYHVAGGYITANRHLVKTIR